MFAFGLSEFIFWLLKTTKRRRIKAFNSGEFGNLNLPPNNPF